MHLANVFIQSNLHFIESIYLVYIKYDRTENVVFLR